MSLSSVFLPLLGKCINRKTEIKRGFLSSGWIEAKHNKKLWKVSFMWNWTSRWCDVYFKRFLSFAVWCFSTGPNSVICGKIEKMASIIATFIVKTRTLNYIQTVKVPECSNNMCTVCFVMWMWLWKGCRLIFPLFSAQQKILSPCTNTQGLTQCNCGIVCGQADKQKHSMALFLASANKQHIATLIITLWTLLANPARLRFEKDVEGLETI